MSLLAAAALAATFNLVCTGTKTTGLRGEGLSLKDKKDEPFTTVYRVDLDSKRWCRDTCSTTTSLAEIATTKLTFEKEEDKELSSDTVAIVNRENGSYAYRQRVFGFVNIQFGQCERAPFTGFPALKF